VICRVRRGVPGDAPQLSAFGRRVYEATFAPDNDPEQLARYLATAYTPVAQTAELADPGITTLLSFDASEALVGFAQVRRSPVPSCVADPSAIELWRFYVDQAWHGRGVAPVLMDAVVSEAAGGARRSTSIWLGVWERNLRAQAFYRKHGFVPVGTHVFMLGTEPQTDQIWMRRT
jgi:diamine N-acetyltransferase